MDELARILLEAADRGRPTSLRGRTDADIARSVEALLEHPYGADVFASLMRSGEGRAADAALRIARLTPDPGVMGEIVREIAVGLPIAPATASALHDALIARAADGTGHWALRAQALLGASITSRSRPHLGYKLVAALLETPLDDDGDHLRHVARIAGATDAVLGVPDLRTKLEDLLDVEACRDEAAMELGLVELRKGLEDRTRETAAVAFAKARDHFATAVGHSEARADAALYHRCLTMLVDFQGGRRSAPVAAEVGAIVAAAFEFSVHAAPADPRLAGTWLADRTGEAVGWSTLAVRLAMLEESLGERAWLEAATVIERQLLVCWSASRSTLGRTEDGGLEAVLRPPISDAVQREQARLQALEAWIERNAGAGSIRDARALLGTVLEARVGRALRTPATGQDDFDVLVDTAFETADARGTVLAEIAAGVERVMLETTPPVVRRKLDEMAGALRGNEDYGDPCARALLDSVLIRTLAWQHDIDNAEPGARPWSDYLFRDDADEADLQRDYLATVRAGTGGGGVRSEARGIGHGRADVAFDMRGVTIVAELKKTEVDGTLEELVDAHGLQATAYQRSNVRLALLIVLDLVDRGGGGEHFLASSRIIAKTPPATTTAYSVCVFRIQGRKATPSSIRRGPRAGSRRRSVSATVATVGG